MSEKITAMIEEIKGLTVLELAELVHALEDTFGVSAAAVAAGPAAAAGPVVEEQTEFARKSAASPAWVWPMPRSWSKAFPPRSRKAFPRKTPRLSKLSSRLPAPLSSSSNLYLLNKNEIAKAVSFFCWLPQRGRHLILLKTGPDFAHGVE